MCPVSQDDFKEFRLPVPGVRRKIMASKVTPGLSAKSRDKSFPAKNHVICVIDRIAKPQVVYLKSEVIQEGVVKNEALDVYFVGLGDAVNAFKGSVAGRPVKLSLNADGTLADNSSGTVWHAHGKYKTGGIRLDLTMVAISDEYGFSWKFFHPDSQLIRLQ
jgi:hypothetical protein